ncbi:hypothetical protein CTZ28_43170 [Streptomyces shenzhenensis]|uniref:Uncharacterized protein n=1 Tax=Streptomyces shenzhenensis TaxID=943815 RepID=A0A3M0I1C5_9ACTN|nr:hypothetical protein CTZ28_43170 [Streptomyces shenzhenensis]
MASCAGRCRLRPGRRRPQRRELRVRDLVRPRLPVGVAHGEWAPGLTCVLDARLPGSARAACVVLSAHVASGVSRGPTSSPGRSCRPAEAETGTEMREGARLIEPGPFVHQR